MCNALIADWLICNISQTPTFLSSTALNVLKSFGPNKFTGTATASPHANKQIKPPRFSSFSPNLHSLLNQYTIHFRLVLCHENYVLSVYG